MVNIHPESLYYDDYNQEKQFTNILAVPGRALQAREVTQIGDIARDFTERLGSAVLKEGGVIAGCVPVVRDNIVTISAGRLFVNGLVRITEQQEIAISGIGSEVIGAKIVSSIITEVQDPSLRDPAQGSQNYGGAGAHRIKEVVEFVLNDPDAVPVFEFLNGELKNVAEENDLWQITEMLARRTYDESGNYKVMGLDLYNRNEIQGDNLIVGLTSGKAYISGFEVVKETNTTVSVPKAVTTAPVLAEPKNYLGGTYSYVLNKQPVATIDKVTAKVSVTETKTRGGIAGGSDALLKTPVVSIESVKQGGKTFVYGTDYILANDSIDWSPIGGSQPTPGTTYQVVYTYNKTMVPGVDYSPTEEDGVTSLTFLEGGDKPVDSTEFQTDYKFYLARKDLVMMDYLGNVMVINGRPDTIERVEPPLNQNQAYFSIGTITAKPNSSEVLLVNFPTTRLTQNEIYNLSRRIDDMQYNISMTDLDKEAEGMEPATSLKGVFTDGFIGFTKADVTHPDYDCTIDLDLEELTLPTSVIVNNLIPNNSSTETKMSEFGPVITAPFVHEQLLFQPLATGIMLVNEYAVYDAICPVEINPSVDNWVDSSKIVVNKETTKVTSLRRWWYHRGEKWAEEERQKYIALGFADGGASLGWNSGSRTTTSVSQKVVLDEAIMYMRSIEVNANCKNFFPGDNVVCKFNDIIVPLTPTGTASAGSTPGSILVPLNGRFTAKFNVPSNVPCGVVDVKFVGEHASGSTTYAAQGRNQVIQETILRTINVVNPYDPIAQSFQFDSDYILSKVGLYFARKSQTKPIVLEIRNMVNGYPGQTAYARQIVDVENINVSDDASAVTEIQLNQPVYLKANTSYCLTVLSDSNEYAMYVAELGKEEIRTHQTVTANPYSAGVLFTSSNAQTWTAHQATDLKFNLYRCQYTGEANIVFEDVSTEMFNRLLIAADSIDYKNNGIEWYYRLPGQTVWNMLDTFVDRDLDNSVNSISLKCVMHVSNTTSPIIPGKALSLISFTDGLTGTYISRTVAMSDKYNSVKISLDLALPAGTNVALYIAGDSEVFHQVTDTPKITEVDGEFKNYIWEVNSLNDKSYKIKIVLSTTNPLVRPRARRLINLFKY